MDTGVDNSTVNILNNTGAYHAFSYTPEKKHRQLIAVLCRHCLGNVTVFRAIPTAVSGVLNISAVGRFYFLRSSWKAQETFPRVSLPRCLLTFLRAPLLHGPHPLLPKLGLELIARPQRKRVVHQYVKLALLRLHPLEKGLNLERGKYEKNTLLICFVLYRRHASMLHC